MLLAEAYLHRLDSTAIPITDGFGVRWYGLAYLGGFVIAWATLRWLAQRGRIGMTIAQVGDLMFVTVLGVLIGGRLGYALFYDPSLFTDFSGAIPFWGLLAINKGGMASHGGIIGVIAGGWIYARRQRISALHLLDLAALLCTPGLFLGRIANFVNGELWGRELPASMHASPPWWSVKYAEEILLTSFPHVAEVHERLGAIVPGGATFLQNVVTAARKGDPAVMEQLRPLLTPYYPSQLIQAITDGPLLALAMILMWLRPRRPGVIGGTFLFTYGVMRFATEFVRQPDADVTPILGLTRGQFFSALMIAAAVIGLPIVLGRDVPKLAPFVRGAVTPAPAPTPTAPRGSRGAA